MKYIPFVNVKQGSASTMRFSHGNTLPLTQLPFGMNAFAPQTKSESSWFFHPADRCLEGVRLTHQPSPWIADYGSLIFLPQRDSHSVKASERWSGYRPEDAILQPHYMKLRFLKSRADFELTPTQRGAAIRVRFDEEPRFDRHVAESPLLSEQPPRLSLSLFPLNGFSAFHYDKASNTLYGMVTNCRDQNAVGFKMYVAARFGENQLCDDCFVCDDNGSAFADSVQGENACIHLLMKSSALDLKIATSYISYEQAELNLCRELEGKSFEEIKAEGERIWESYLSRVEIEPENDDQMKTFYSCMYRAFLYPHKCYEQDKDNRPIHYCPSDGSVRNGVRYTDNGFWDTYRTVYPFFALVAEDEYREMCEGFVNDYKECGWLPRWPSIGERGCMPSTLLDAVLCDAAVKGILTGKTLEDAFEGMLKHANVNSVNDDYGRSGAESYVRLGYVPIEAHKESVNLTLDAAYGDWCIARIAEILGKNDVAAEYDRRAKNYKNLFDPSTGFMRARFEDGSFRKAFDPFSWGLDYTEGSAWQNSFAVPHDIEGLASLYGGKEKLIAKIDALFNAPPVYDVGGYGFEIHEMTEMAAVDFGQCAISNQPSFHIPYIYSALGDVEKTSFWVERICKELFSHRDDGFPGDEDNGSMALWYVFSNIGVYPFCPGKNEFVRTKKLVKSVKILGREFDADAFEGNKIPFSALKQQKTCD